MTVYGTCLSHIPFLSSIFNLVLKDFEARGFISLFLCVFAAQWTDPLQELAIWHYHRNLASQIPIDDWSCKKGRVIR